ncbi:MAG: outer membrane protein assembly factor [Alphaproteobacteria bacterium]|nr:outer membrane protein assembly factor [Alphaproteobacteria bacterium]
MAKLLEEVSDLVQSAGRLPATMLALQRRIAGDRDRLLEVLRSEGYYGASIEVDRREADGTQLVELRVVPGPRFGIASFTLVLAPDSVAAGLRQEAERQARVRIGEPARAASIIDVERGIIVLLGRNGHPKARRTERKVVVDHARAAADIRLEIDAGEPVTFGPPLISGTRDVRPSYIRRQLAWREGALFDNRHVDDTRRDLVRSNLFETVRVSPAETAAPDGSLPVEIEVREREHRSIGFGLGYSTDLGFGGKVFWEHRNLFGEGESLNLEARATQRLYGGAARYRERGFLSRRNTLLLDLETSEERFEAYRARSVATGAALERDLGNGFAGSLGVTLEALNVRQAGETDRFVLVSLPARLRRDTTDNLLDPTRGHRLRLEYTPFFQPDDPDLNFHRVILAGSAYQGFFEGNRVVLAARAQLGFIFGPPTADIPANRRLYAGGGGSVRGYEFQSLGPLDADGDPVGGRSIVEAGIEARIRLFGGFGIVPFLDIGNAYDDERPDLDQGVRVATGIGLRYTTPIGPIRADIAFPLNRRRGIDDAFQFYVSLGQAF